MQTRLRITFFGIGLLLASTSWAQEKMPPKITYEDDVKPILRQKCFSCHNPDKKSGDLDLTNYTSLMQGGGSGAVIEAGDSAASYLYMLVTHQSEPYMPPESPKLPDDMVETFRKWIDGGVLETKDSTAKASKKKTFDFALKTVPTERPAIAPLPPRLSLEPVTHTATTTAISAMATNPWSPIAAVAGQKQVLLYNTQTLQLVGALPFPEGFPDVLKFSRNGSLLLAGGGRGGASGKVVVWNILTGDRIIEVGDELDAVLAADISSDQTLIALGGPQKVVRIYSTESGQLLHELRKHTDWIYTLEFSPDSVLLASGDRNGGLMVWEGWTGREYLVLNGHTAAVTEVSWRSDSNVLASASEDTTIRLWEMENGGQIKNWGAHGGGASSLEFTRDGRILSCGRDRVAKLWDQNGTQLIAFEAFSDLALRTSFCDETNRAIAADWTGAIRVWNAADGARIGELAANPPLLADRLAAANQALTARQAEHKPLADTYVALQSAADKAKADLAAAEQTAAATKKQLDDAVAKNEAAKVALAQATQADDAAKKAVDLLAAGLPPLTEGAAKALEAAAKLPEDKELAELAAKLKAVADQRAAQLETNKKVAAEKATLLATAKDAQAAAEKEAAAADAAYKAAAEQVQKLTPLVKPAEDQATAAKQAADAAAATLAAAQAEVDRWNGEIAFTTQLRQFGEQRDAAMKTLGERESQHADLAAKAQAAVAALDKAKADLAAAQANAANGQKQVDATLVQLQSGKDLLAKAEVASQQAATAVSALETILGPLAEAATKAQDAATKDANDKEVADAAAKLKAVVDAKKTALEAAKKDAAEKVAAAEAAKQQLATYEKQAADAKVAYEAAQKTATDLAAAVKPVEEQATVATAAVQPVLAGVQEAQKVVEQIDAQIAAAKGIKAA